MAASGRCKSKKLLAWVREMACCVQDLSCNGPIEAHHLMKPWVDGRGMGMKATDKNVVPLCAFHHRQMHTKYGDEFKFFAAHFRPESYGQLLAERIYRDFTGDGGGHP